MLQRLQWTVECPVDITQYAERSQWLQWLPYAAFETNYSEPMTPQLLLWDRCSKLRMKQGLWELFHDISCRASAKNCSLTFAKKMIILCTVDEYSSISNSCGFLGDKQQEFYDLQRSWTDVSMSISIPEMPHQALCIWWQLRPPRRYATSLPQSDCIHRK